MELNPKDIQPYNCNSHFVYVCSICHHKLIFTVHLPVRICIVCRFAYEENINIYMSRTSKCIMLGSQAVLRYTVLLRGQF